jgi:hypothetical protein
MFCLTLLSYVVVVLSVMSFFSPKLDDESLFNDFVFNKLYGFGSSLISSFLIGSLFIGVGSFLISSSVYVTYYININGYCL